jgi:hypothetical protein
MTEPILGIAAAVLLGLSITALFLRPRRSRGRVVDIGLATGAGLLGLAIGLVVAERVNPPVIMAMAAPEPLPTQSAPPAARYVESRLSLQFPIDDEYPIGSDTANVADWYAFRNSISYVPGASEKLGKTQDQTLKLLADVSWSWLIVVAFDQPTRYSRINVNFTGGELPYYQITRQDPHYAVIHVQGHIPPGQMEITTGE